MFKNFLIKKMLKSQMKDAPEEQIDMILGVVEKNPELFKKIAEEVQSKISQGFDQMTASMEVMRRYENELKSAKL